ncbi:hypothetical protein DTL21_19685 [Bremerella cremea]|uniref:Uncharacterized protein n=1 Tax=Blastopirellula marina TaxID=124 RepID=A0A2S8FJS6_9BACT|nr:MULTISPECIES: hypothetical protein [Pirellulaceae]PQO32439.1 hypothetical protein C5Y83_19665 [Blastopirellula marina]RCS45506.1 hypothetical protein DTL21_19685 [Bremerella cremea]
MAQGSSSSPYDESRQRRIEAFVREAEAFLASRGGLDPSTLPALAYQHGLDRDEFQEAMYLVYSSPPPSSKRPAAVETPPPAPPKAPSKVETTAAATSEDDGLFPPEVLAQPAPPSSLPESNTSDDSLVSSELVDEYDFPGIRPQDLYNFVRQARLVLADEQGWNERSLARLNYLADQLLIPHAVRSDLFRRLDDRNFNPPAPTAEAVTAQTEVTPGEPSPPEAPVPTAAQEEEEEEARQREERKKRHSPSRLYTHYLKKALEALPTKRINQRREEKLVREGTAKLGLSEVLAHDLLREVAQEKGYVLISETEEPSETTQKAASEEVVVDFQQRAATIIAGQGGVNSLTRIMIAQVATDLGLTDEQRDAALASIQKQTEKNEVDTRLQQRAASFKEFVRTKLEAIAHGIVIASLAQKLVQIGVDMHGIDEELAWHALRDVLQEEDLRLVTVDQARSHVSTLVDDILIQEQFLSIQNRQRLMSEGEQWGLTPGRCEQLIDQRVADFTRKKHRTQRQVVLIFTAFFALLVGGGAYVVYLESTPPKGSPLPTKTKLTNNSDGSTEPVAKSDDTPTEAPKKPVWQRQPWWGEKLSLALLSLYQQESSLQNDLTAICTDDEKRRINAYRTLIPELVHASVSHPNESQQLAVRDAIVGLVRDEPSDDAVAAIADELTAGISLKDSSVPSPEVPAQRLEKAYLSITAADQSGLPTVRRDAFLDKLAQQLGIAYSSAIPPLELTMNEMVRDQYRKLRELIPNDSSMAAQLHVAVSQAAKNYLPEDQISAKDSTLVAEILTKLTDNWEAYQPTVQNVIDSPKPERLLPLIDAFSQSLRDEKIQRELAVMFSKRIGQQLDAEKPIQAAEIVRTELGLDSAVASDGEMQRMFSQRASAFSWDVAPDISPDMLANEVTRLSYLSVLGHAAGMGDLGRRTFEETLDKGPPQREDDSSSGKPISTAAMAALSKAEALISRLPRATNPLSRIDNYRELCVIAGDVQDVDYETASLLAQYILSTKPRAEQSQLQVGFRAFSHWTNFKLAMADQLPEARRAADDLQEIVSALLGESVSITDVRSARDELRTVLLRHALDSLGSNSPAGSQNISSKAANDTASLLVDHYRLHARLEGISTEQLSGIELPDVVADRLIELEQGRLNGMSLNENESSEMQDITRQKIALDYLSSSPIASMAVRQRIWLKLMALRIGKERPRLKAPLAQLINQLETRDASSANLFEQLRSGELALVKFWELTGGAA